MIIGKGLIAETISNYFDKINLNHENYLIFASGVSNSKENRDSEFQREIDLFNNTILEHKNKIIVYFSSCALVNKKFLDIPYYEHKYNMENLIKGTNNFIILRLPQVIGNSNNENTILNFFIKKIRNNEKLNIQKNTYRYFVDINDVSIFLGFLLKHEIKNIILDFGNFYRYPIPKVVKILKSFFNEKYTNFELVEGNDEYIIDFSLLKLFFVKYNIEFNFSEEYLKEKIEKSYYLGNKK